MPTQPLDLLRRGRAAAFTVAAEGRARVNGRSTSRLVFRERPPGGIIACDEATFVRVDVRAWVDDSGAIHRADVTLHAPTGRGEHNVRVDFVPHRQLEMLVPHRLSESFDKEFTGEGHGHLPQLPEGPDRRPHPAAGPLARARRPCRPR
ncbi:MAG: hypothetical protein KA371_11655 [Acidobacteria bacterium]|nr:hypothetical protein [Acidobacteriota bacterium]